MPHPTVLQHLLHLQRELVRQPEKEWPELLRSALTRLPGVIGASLETEPVAEQQASELIVPLPQSCGLALRLQLADRTAFAPYHEHVEQLCGLLADILAPRRAAATAADRDWYRALVAALRDPVLVADMETGLLTVCNTAAEAFFGRTQAQLVGLPFCALVAADSGFAGEDSAACLRRLVEFGDVVEAEFVTADGIRRVASVRMNALEIGGRLSVAGMLRDVTTQKTLQLQLDSSRRELDNFRMLLESMADTMPDMLWAKDTQGRYLFANPAIRGNLLCSDDEEVLGRTDVYFALRQRALGQHHTFGELCINSDEVVLESRVPGRFEEDGYVRGAYLMLDVQKAPLFDRDGNLLGTVGTGRDITARKRAEEELRAKTAMLEAQVNATLDGILVINERGERVLCNRGLIELFAPPEDVLNSVDDTPLLQHVTSLVRDPEIFLARVEELYAAPRSVSREELALRDGRILERYTAPVLGQDGISYGRIWMFRDITAGKLAEQSLRQSEERFRTLTQVAPLGIFRTDARGRCTYVNEYWSVISGYPGEQALGLGWMRTLHPAHRQPALRAFRASLGARREFAEEFCFQSENTTCTWFLLRAAPEFSIQGQFLGFVGAIMDISARRNSEEALRNSQRQLREIIDLVPHFIFAKDEEGRFLLANQALATAYGTTVTGLIGRRDADFSATAEEAEFFCRIDRLAMQSGRTQTVAEEAITLATGQMRRLSTIKVPFRFSGTDAPAVLGVAVDITEQKRAEEALSGESQRRTILMESSNDGIVIIDQNHRVVEANRRFAEMLGYDRDEIIGLYTWDYEAVLDEARIRSEFSCMEDVQQIFETRHRRKDGSVFDVEVSLSGTPVAGQGLVFAVCRDITSRRMYQSTLYAAKEAAEAASRAKSIFLANMSHELRTPLNGLMGMLQLIQSSDVSVEVDEYIALAMKAGARLTNLLNDILDLSRIEAGKMTLDLRPFTVAELTSALSETFILLHQDRKVSLSIGLEPDVPPTVLGDKVRVRQILFNLVGNAIKFTTQGVVSVHISTLRPLPDGRIRLLFLVADTGIGIPASKLNDICAPFTQVAEEYTRSHQGAGLGLSIVRSLVDLMDGTLTFDSELERGTTVALVLPFALPEPDGAGRRGRDRSAVPCAPLRILVAEDDEMSSLGVQISLGRMGHRVDTVGSGVDALERLAQTFYDCVLMDVQMRDMDGITATRHIRNGDFHVLNPGVPIIAITAYAMVGDRERFLAAGMDGYLPKPVQFEDLGVVLAGIARESGA